MEKIKHDIDFWLNENSNLLNTAYQIAGNSNDVQRKKIAYALTREVLVQYQELQHLSGELLKNMQELEDFMASAEKSKKYAKSYWR